MPPVVNCASSSVAFLFRPMKKLQKGGKLMDLDETQEQPQGRDLKAAFERTMVPTGADEFVLRSEEHTYTYIYIFTCIYVCMHVCISIYIYM